MPEFLPAPLRARFGVRGDGVPLAALAVGPDAAAAVHGTAGVDPGDLEGWRIVALTTMTVVEGPDGLGFLVGADPYELPASGAWAELVEAHGGAVVVFVDDEAQLAGGVEPLLERVLPGGFVRSVAV